MPRFVRAVMTPRFVDMFSRRFLQFTGENGSPPVCAHVGSFFLCLLLIFVHPLNMFLGTTLLAP